MALSLPLEFSLSPKHQGLRLDAALAEALPGYGVRARRRLWDWCLVTVDGTPRPCGFAVQAGQTVKIVPLQEQTHSPACSPANVQLVTHSKDYYALAKPAGLNTASIQGGAKNSLEGLLPDAWHTLAGSLPVPHSLLTRLDQGTSGLVLAARSAEAASNFRQWEKHGKVRKTYFALAHCPITPPAPSILVKNALNTENRSTTLVLEQVAPPTRWTRACLVTPAQAAPLRDCSPPSHLFPASGGGEAAFPLLPAMNEAPTDKLPETSNAQPSQFTSGFALLQAIIECGARHQIRAHLAFAGFPLWQDPLYAALCPEEAYTSGPASVPPPTRWAGYLLHHATLTMPGFEARLMPPPEGWSAWEPAGNCLS